MVTRDKQDVTEDELERLLPLAEAFAPAPKRKWELRLSARELEQLRLSAERLGDPSEAVPLPVCVDCGDPILAMSRRCRACSRQNLLCVGCDKPISRYNVSGRCFRCSFKHNHGYHPAGS